MAHQDVRARAIVVAGVLWALGCTVGTPRVEPDAAMEMMPDAGHLSCSPQDGDGDGIADELEPSPGVPDTDGDGVPDSEEARSSSPCVPMDTDYDGTPDYMDADSDDDGVTDAREREAGTDPTSIDSDDDDVSDLGELAAGSDPLDASSTIPAEDFFVVLPYGGAPVERTLRFETNIGRADVYFLLDTTGSMNEEVTAIQTGLETTIIPGVRDLVADAQFGAGGFDDFAIGMHGQGNDLPYYHLVDIVPADQDLGALGPRFVRMSNVLTFRASGANGTPDIVDAVHGYIIHSGQNGCESGVEALHQLATGAGVSWPIGPYTHAIPPRVCPTIAGEDARTGYPCFRHGALPIVLYVSDAPFHDPVPDGWPLDTLDPPGSCTYSDVASAATYAAARDELRTMGARVIALSTDYVPSRPTYPATAQMCNLARDTGAVRADGTPLCFELGTSGTGITSAIVDAIATLVQDTPQDVAAITEDVAGNPDDFDARLFVESIVPVEGYGPDGVPGPRAGISYESHDETTFFQVIPGASLEFRVVFHNDVRPAGDTAQVFQARIVVVGNGVARLDERRVFVIVPPEGGVVLI